MNYHSNDLAKIGLKQSFIKLSIVCIFPLGLFLFIRKTQLSIYLFQPNYVSNSILLQHLLKSQRVLGQHFHLTSSRAPATSPECGPFYKRKGKMKREMKNESVNFLRDLVS